LPYQILAGVEPVTGGWLVAAGNLQGVTLGPRPAFVQRLLADVLDYRPSFTVVAIHAPVGLMDGDGEERPCEIVARRMLGPARARSVVPAPSRRLLEAKTLGEARHIDRTVDVVRWATLPRSAESAREVQSWRQRTVFEVHPELAFLQMNGGDGLRHGRETQLGRQERAALVIARLPGATAVLRDRPPGVRESKLIDALADLWTARRIRAHAITRLGDPPVWNNEGIRIDIVC
jgi:predicted RNase H-like nuclease